jgi:hypothetical protein
MRYLPLSIAALLLLSACSNPAPTEPPAQAPSAAVESTPEAAEPTEESGPIAPGQYAGGSFEFTSINGGTGVIEIPATAPADLAQLDTADTAFMAVDVDNRKGSENINMYSVNLYDEVGVEYAFMRETSWMDEMDDNGVSVDTYNSYLDGVSPGQRKTVYMIGPALPEEFVAVMVEPTGQMEEPVQATPVE